MTSYEWADLFFTANQSANMAMANFMAVIFAMLAAGYFVAHKLDRISTILLVALFTVFVAGMGNEVFSLYSDMGRIGAELARAGADPASDLTWFGPAGTDGAFLEHVVAKVVGVICILAYTGTVWFFFRRRAVRDAES